MRTRPGFVATWDLGLVHGTEVLVAASPVLTRRSEGSSPSGPTANDAASGGRKPPDEWPHLMFDNLVVLVGAHDVRAACCLARAEVRVQLPLGALIPQPLVAALQIAVEPVLVRAGAC